MSQLLSTNDAARAVGVGPSTVKRWADAGLLACVRTAGGHRRFALADVERLARAGGEHADATSLAFVELLVQGRAYEVEGQLCRARGRLGAWHHVANALGTVIDEIGRLWQVDRLTVLEEHSASEWLARTLARVGEGLPLAADAPTCLLACAEDDEHALGLALAELTLREAGWRPVWSGRRTPTSELVRRIGRGDLRLVALSASSYSHDPRPLGRQARRVATACRAAGATLVLGGRGAWPDGAGGAARLHRFDELHAFLRELAPRAA
jgi:MerR family transcriptional regulator, light-induced transcriptional regulator